MSDRAGRVRPRAGLWDEDGGALLDPSHPLAHALADVRHTALQTATAAALLVGAGAGVLVEPSAGPAVVVAAATAVLCFSLRLKWAGTAVRFEARRTIAHGGADLPLRCVQAERRRLSDPRLHAHLARWVDELADVPESDHGDALWSVAAVRDVRPELRAVGTLLRSGEAGVRGVALLEDLLTNGGTPLYGVDARALAEQLGRIRYHLSARA